MKRSLSIKLITVFILCISLAGCSVLNNYIIEKSTQPSTTAEPTTVKYKTNFTASRIFYNTLDDAGKKAYDNIYGGIMAQNEEFYVSESLETDDVFDILYYVLNDNPEIFWTQGEATFSSNGNMSMSYSLTSDEITAKTAAIEAKAEQIMSEINPAGDDYSRALAVFDYIADSVVYSNQSENKGYNPVYTLEGALINSSAVCSGYTKAYQYLLSLTGIKSTLISGESKGDSHAWLMVELDGERYYSDVTWGDQTDSETCFPHINHYYFAMNNAQLLKEHNIDKECDLFKCTASADNYYEREGLNFTTYDYDAVLNACIDNENKSAKGYIEFYIDSEEEYKRAVVDLVDKVKASDLGEKVLGHKCKSYVESGEGYLVLI